MGKYLKKSKIAGDNAFMELSPQSSLGVRTRAKTLALQKLQKSSSFSTPDLDASSSYLQLRSRRRLPKMVPGTETHPPLLQKKSFRERPKGNFCDVILNSIVDEKEGLCSGVFGMETQAEELENNDVGIEGSYGENLLEVEGRDSTMTDPVHPTTEDQVSPSAQHSEPLSVNQRPSEGEPSHQPERKGRTGTRLRDVSLGRSAGEKIPIQFDRYWKPIGPNASRYRSFIGLLARNKPSILIEEWRNVDNKVKQHILDTIQLTYDVPQSEILYKKTMTYCCERWRKFKTNLANTYVHIEVPAGQPRPTPCSKYSYIDEATWQEFFRLRTTPEALARRQKAQESGRKNDCPHTMSRGGYAKAEKDLLAAKRRRLEEASQFDPSVLQSPPSPIRREELWLHARRKSGGSYTSEQSRIIGEKIEELQKKQAEGSFKPEGRNDILTVASGKREHPGRVRGVGGGVGIRDYFGSSSFNSFSNMVTRDELERRLATARAEARAEVEASIDALLEARLSKMKEEVYAMVSTRQDIVPAQAQSLDRNKQSTKESCCNIGQSSEGSGKDTGESCDIFVEDPLRRLVARGRVHNLGSTVHHQQMTDDQVRVSVEEVIIADASVPIPSEEFKIVSDALDTFISWPKNLVSVRAVDSPIRASTPAPFRHEVSQPLLNVMQQVILMAYDTSFQTRSWPTDSVVGKSGPMCYLDREDLMSLVTPKQDLTITIVQLFLMYMNRRLVSSGLSSKFGFMCPVHVTETWTSSAIRHRYLSERLGETETDCFLVPYVHGSHWQLVILCKASYTVILLCSLHFKPGNDLKKTVNSAMRIFLHTKSGRHVRDLKDPTWIMPKTRRQPPGSNLCGLYILRQIYNIITLGTTDFTEMFDLADPFPEEDIDFIRNCCAEFIYELLQN